MLRRLFLWCSESAWLAEKLPRMPFVRRSVRRFVPGEELDDALNAVDRLRDHGIASVLTRLGEHVHTEAAAEAVADHYVGVLERAAETGRAAEISVKLTQLGLEQSTGLALRSLSRLTAEAAARDNFVWVDMEDSSYVDRTLEVYRGARSERENVGLCMQAYLRRTAADLDEVLPLGATVRLVKGAYDEPADVAFPAKADVDENYASLAIRLLDHIDQGGGRQAFATHDVALLERVRTAARTAGIEPKAYEIQMLYGIQSEAQRRLAAEGETVRCLISYGSEWFAWYMRRLAERPANVGFVLRNLLAG